METEAGAAAARRHGSDAGVGRPASKRWIRGSARAVVLVLAFVALTAFHMAPAARDCGSTIMGSPGDATNGGVWLGWIYDEGASLAEPTTTASAAPEGETFWQPHYLTAVLVFGAIWAFTKVTNEVCAWNLAVASGFVVTGVVTFLLARSLSRSSPAAFVASYAYTFSAFRQIKAEGHFAYVHAQSLVLLLASSIWLCRRPGWRPSLATGASLALAVYTDGYYLLLAPALAAGYVLAHAVWRRRDKPWLKQLALAASGAAGVAAVAAAPLAAAFLGGKSDLGAALPRRSGELDAYGARPWEFLLPSQSNPLTMRWFRDWQLDHLHGSSPGETTLYLGWVVIVLAAGAIWLTATRPGRPGSPPRGVVVGLVGVAILGVVMSLPGTLALGPLRVPTPPRLVFELVGLWRVHSRFFIVIHLAFCILAAFGAAAVFRRLRPRTAAIVTAVLVVMISLESLLGWPRTSYSYDNVPEVYRWIATRPETILAEYPLMSTSDDPDHRFLGFQPVHEKDLFNARVEPSESTELRNGLSGLADPQTIPVLRRLGVGLIAVHLDLARVADETPPPGLELLRTSSDGARIDVYRVTPGPRADTAIALVDGFGADDRERFTSARWMGDRATVEVRRLAGSATRSRISFVASSFGGARQLTIAQNGRQVWAGVVALDTVVDAVVDVGVPLTLRSPAGTRRISDLVDGSDHRDVSFTIGAFASSPA